MMLRSVILFIFALALLSGCSTVQESEATQEYESAALAKELCGLSPSVDPAEAARAADAAVRYPLQLAREYHATLPPLMNNILINTGIHPRGLCFQWADDLTVKLMTLHLRTLELHRGVAWIGTAHEHSSVVLTAPGQDFNSGIALDAWRYRGRLHWLPVTLDQCPWKEVALIPSYQADLRAAAEKLEEQSK
jgi:hypothetical protein